MEAMAGHKVSDTATGCVGTVSWKLGDWDKMLVVMYSVPYSHDFHSNWLAVGIFNIEDTTDLRNDVLQNRKWIQKEKILP